MKCKTSSQRLFAVFLIVSLLVCVLAAGCSIVPESDQEKIVGRWRRSPGDLSYDFEFFSNGKLYFVGAQTYGRYTLDGDHLNMELPISTHSFLFEFDGDTLLLPHCNCRHTAAPVYGQVLV